MKLGRSKNKYYPADTNKIFSLIRPEEWNFYFLFNMPFIIENRERLPEKIRINEGIQNFRWDSDFLKNLEKRVNGLVQNLRKSGLAVEPITAKCNWRLVIGLGATHPQETSMTLHHIYGIPYIPGSAVKGVTRHWAVLRFADEKAKEEKKDFYEIVKEISYALENGNELNLEVDEIKFMDLIKIFGTQQKKGEIIFFDAFPVDNINLKIDIMNPHYPDYYGKDNPPADWQDPRPVKFLTIENTKFQFYLAGKDNKLLSKAKELLKKALKESGVGAKTSLGYGVFE